MSVWLCQIAKHLWYQHLRKRKPEEPLPEDGLPGPSAEEDVLTRQGHLDLLRQIHALPPSTREVVYLRAFRGPQLPGDQGTCWDGRRPGPR